MAKDDESRYELIQQLIPLLDRPTRPNAQGAVMAFCPIHGDGKKSGRRSLSVGPKYGVRCFAGCNRQEIIDYYLGSNRESTAPTSFEDKLGDPTATYEYYSPSGELVVTKGRFERGREKTFRHKPKNAQRFGGLAPLTESEIPLYHAPDIVRTPKPSTVYFVEGEKAADACKAQGLLATTLYPSAGSKAFNAEQFEILRGHSVVLWPDNDPPGREHMLRVESVLRDMDIEYKWIILARTLPYKGDAYDFFYKQQGTVAELQGASVVEPALEFLEDAGIQVTVPTAGRIFRFTFTDIERSKRAMEAELYVRPLDAKEGIEDYVERINLLSSTQVTELRRNLDNVYGKDFGWTRAVANVTSLTRNAYDTVDRSIYLEDINVPDDDLFLVQDLLPFGAPTCWFGDGSSGKSMLAEVLVVSLAAGLNFARFDAPVCKTLFVDYEDTAANFRRRCERIASGLGIELPIQMIRYWDSNGVPMPQLVDALRKKVREEQIDLVVIDSIAPACGGDPLNSEVVDSYFRAIRKLNVTTLHIAHITKEAGEKLTFSHPATMKPFGSIMWHNRFRRTWWIKREQEYDADDIEIGFINRKVNDGTLLSPRYVDMTFEPDQGPITVERTRAPREGSALAESRPWAQRIWDVLTRPMTVLEVANEFDIMADDKNGMQNIRNVLNRRKDMFVPIATPSSNGVTSQRFARVATEYEQEQEYRPLQPSLANPSDQSETSDDDTPMF